MNLQLYVLIEQPENEMTINIFQVQNVSLEDLPGQKIVQCCIGNFDIADDLGAPDVF